MKRIFIIAILIIAGAVAPAAYADWLGNMVQQGVNNAAENQVQQAAPQQSQNSPVTKQDNAGNSDKDYTEGEIIQAEEAAQNNDFKEAFNHYYWAAKNHARPINDMGTKKKIIDGVNALVDKTEAMGDKYAKKGDRKKASEYYSMIDDAYYDVVFYGKSDDGSGNVIVNQDKWMKVRKKLFGQ